jgi:hypothetical protein
MAIVNSSYVYSYLKSQKVSEGVCTQMANDVSAQDINGNYYYQAEEVEAWIVKNVPSINLKEMQADVVYEAGVLYVEL